MMLASIWSGKHIIRAFVTENQRDIIKRNRGKTRVIRDFHGYGNDYTLEARLIGFNDVRDSDYEVLKRYVNMIESYSEEIEYLISDCLHDEEMEMWK